MAFERFTRKRARTDAPKASIWSRGQIGFNYAATDEYKLDKFKYAVLYYDRETNRIGIEFTNDRNAEGTSKVIHRKGAGVSISALAFLRHYKINFSATTTHNLIHDDKSGFYVIDLTK